MPGLPRVAADEAEARRRARQPAVGRRRPQVELRAEAVQRRSRRRHPARVGVGGEEPRLLGVGAVGAGDRQRHAVGAPCGGQAVEGQRHVRAHPAPLANGQRPAVVPGPRPARQAPRRQQLGLRGDRAAEGRAQGDQRIPHRDADAHRREPRAREGHRHVRGAVAPGRRPRRLRAQPQVGVPGQVHRVRAAVDHGRRKDPVMDGPQRPGAGQRGEVRRPLPLGPLGEARPDRADDDRADHDRQQHTDQEHGGLTGLPAAKGRTTGGGAHTERSASLRPSSRPPAPRRRHGGGKAARGRRHGVGGRLTADAAGPVVQGRLTTRVRGRRGPAPAPRGDRAAPRARPRPRAPAGGRWRLRWSPARPARPALRGEAGHDRARRAA